MSTVKFSKGLIDSIKASAKNKMQPAVERAKEQRPAHSWGQIIYGRIFGSQIPLVQQLPNGWTQFRDSILIDTVGDQRCDLSFELSKPMHWPYEFPNSEVAKGSGSYRGGLRLVNAPIWEDLQLEVKTYNERVAYAVARQTEFVESVTKLLGTYSTLAPALKAWPPLWELVSEDVKSQHRLINTRVKKEIEITVDLDKMTALSTAAKFGI
jgi:hypothetical protein